MGIATFVLFLTCLVGLSYAAPAPIPAVHQQREAREETVPENGQEHDNTSGESTMGERPLIFQCVEVSSSSAAAVAGGLQQSSTGGREEVYLQLIPQGTRQQVYMQESSSGRQQAAHRGRDQVYIMLSERGQENVNQQAEKPSWENRGRQQVYFVSQQEQHNQKGRGKQQVYEQDRGRQQV